MSGQTFGLLDTSILIDHGDFAAAQLPDVSYVPAVALAELASGLYRAPSAADRAARRARLQWARNAFEILPFDALAAVAYGEIVEAARAAGRKTKRRMGDYLIAATAMANDLPLYTLNPRDFVVAKSMVKIIAISAPH